jgi:hypothetical protein
VSVALCIIRHPRLRCEFTLLVGGQEAGRQAVCLQAQTSLASPRHIKHQRHSPLIRRTLEKDLVLDEVLVDKVAHAGADVPAHALGVHVDLPQKFDHLCLVCNVALGSGCRGGQRS